MTQSLKGKTLWLLSYLLLLGTFVYFSKAMNTVHPPYYLVAGLAGAGLILAGIFSATKSNLLNFLLFQILQGVVGWALAYFLFGMELKASLAFPAGALAAFLAAWVLSCGYSTALSGLLSASVLAGGLVVGLRLEGIPGGLSCSLALLNSYWLGNKLFSQNQRAQDLWLRSALFFTLLAVGRAAIQYYLVQSNYANLGVVLTHPYTYLALVAGIFLPAALWVFSKENILHPILNILLFGIALPLILGFYLHVRPTAGFLLGLVTAVFLFGMLFEETLSLVLITYLALLSTVLGLPYFKELSNLSRVLRLEILAGLFGVAVILFLLNRLIGAGKRPA